MLFDCHLDIQTYEFAHMSVSERVLGPKDWTDLENALEISHNTHLFVQLGGLG